MKMMASRRPTILALASVFLLAPNLLAAATNTKAKVADAAVAEPTFYKDVLPVLQANCQVCHRPGGANLGGMVAPMSFTDYASTRPWAKSIAKQVEARTMPPWHASPNQHGIFVNERVLSDIEIQTLVNWAKAGAPPGNATDAPPVMEFAKVEGGWSTGQPDLELVNGEPYFVKDEVEDQYVTFTTEITEEMLPEPRWVKSIEFLPGSSVVHHIVAPPLGGIAPGNQPSIYPEGYGTLLKPGDTVRWSMHYHKEPGPGTGVWDQSRANIQFYPKGYTPEHRVVVDPLARFDFVLPPGEDNVTYTTRTKFERDSLLLSILPHMHLRGKSAKYVAHYPDGAQEVLLEVPRYDFNWQTAYEYPADAHKLVPAGTEVEFIATWDNSPNNPSNPDPTEEVRFGEPTTAEMMFGFLTYADAEPGYVPAGGGWLSPRSERKIDPETMKRILKERMDIDWDSLSPEKQQEFIQRFQGGKKKDASADGTGD